jgi:pheromone shutdown protein TraB
LRLVILGVGHVFKIGAQLTHILMREHPPVVAVELDAGRLQGLYETPESRKRLTAQASGTYRRMAEFQESMAEVFGAEVGSEMRVAVDVGRAMGSRIELIDVEAQAMVARIDKEMTLMEKVRFGWEMLRMKFSRRSHEEIQDEVKQLQEDPMAMLNEMGRRFPTIKRILLDERNAHMGARLRNLVEQHHHVVAVVGDGHVPGLVEILGDLSPVVVRLKEIRDMQVPPEPSLSVAEGGRSIKFSFTQDVVGFTRSPPF